MGKGLELESLAAEVLEIGPGYSLFDQVGTLLRGARC
jgi:hypothetical protein